MSKREPVIALVVAVADNGAIGWGGDLPWLLSSDLKQFRKLTLGKPVIMGRRTFESLGRVLDQRVNIVLSRDPDFAVITCFPTTYSRLRPLSSPS